MITTRSFTSSPLTLLRLTRLKTDHNLQKLAAVADTNNVAEIAEAEVEVEVEAILGTTRDTAVVKDTMEIEEATGREALAEADLTAEEDPIPKELR